MTSLQLRAHLEDLPQELYNEIYDLTFTSPVNTIICVEELQGGAASQAPCPWNLMQVSSGTRTMVAASYYSENVFIVRNVDLLFTWLDGMPSVMRHLLKDVRCRKQINDSILGPGGPWTLLFSHRYIRDWVERKWPDMMDNSLTLGYVEPIKDKTLPSTEQARVEK
ncbi:uncharacterized protein RCC_07061 [Ramularia collo-cygni]|uniref:Uncharacterized protein n=1 Tax=Ramularia collo-cygni TaxID=112498 RepID=A0A2D3VH06_9PEZI|nr:uncharacterized protein RCC_07061 [Ramularia collo-cygni]CZT21199.1 uncharacterized protein RCC_07061 [Ramularia collo-cygni]